MKSAKEWVLFRWSALAIILPALVISALAGVFVSIALGTGLPLLGAKSPMFALILMPSLVMLLLTFARGDVGIGLIVFAATIVISKTGMQLDIGAVRTSALEFLILAGTFVLLERSRVIQGPPQWPRLSLDRPLLWFAVLTFPALVIAVVRQVLGANLIWELKAYFLYPCLAYIIVAWTRTPSRWKWVAFIGVAFALVDALTGIWSWWRGTSTLLFSLDGVSYDRAGGDFGVINQYGFYLSTFVLVVLGFVVGIRNRFNFALAILMLGLLLMGVVVTGSRGPWVGLLVGFIAFTILRPKRLVVMVPVLVLGLGLFLWRLPSIEARTALEAGSDQARISYVLTGFEVLKNYPIFGAGWGAGFWLGPNNQLLATDGLPQLHNDYLNLVTQVGILGLLAFLWLWWRVLAEGFAKIRTIASGEMGDAMTGVLAALLALLVEAGTDHVFWRPDIAGLVWWLTGMLLAGVTLSDSPIANEEISDS